MKILLVNKFFFMKGGAETVYFQERDMLLSEGVKIVEFSMQHEKNIESEYSEFFCSKCRLLSEADHKR